MHFLMTDLEKENAELKARLAKYEAVESLDNLARLQTELDNARAEHIAKYGAIPTGAEPLAKEKGTRGHKATPSNEEIASGIKAMSGKLSASRIQKNLNISAKTFTGFLASKACNIKHNGLEKAKSAYKLTA